jgi:hypothetical protein
MIERQPPTRASAVTSILHHIQSLESYVERIGARLVRTTLPDRVQGRVIHDLITLRADLNPEQQLLTLVHELVHWLAHRDAAARAHCAHCTIFEYEAEAVEALVMARLGLARTLDDDCPTDGLLSASLARVNSATSRICHALGIE